MPSSSSLSQRRGHRRSTAGLQRRLDRTPSRQRARNAPSQLRIKRTTYDYAGQDPINGYDLSGEAGGGGFLGDFLAGHCDRKGSPCSAAPIMVTIDVGGSFFMAGGHAAISFDTNGGIGFTGSATEGFGFSLPSVSVSKGTVSAGKSSGDAVGVGPASISVVNSKGKRSPTVGVGVGARIGYEHTISAQTYVLKKPHKHN
jgi:hypothetical protein